MVKNYTDKQLLDKVKATNGFKAIPKDYWLLAVRSEADAFDTFDDKVYLFKGEKCEVVTTCTTHPGGPVLVGGWKKYNKLGAAVIKSNEWYYDGFKYGLHNGKMPALRQVKNFKYYRDGNNDKKVDEVGTIYEAIYNTNFHFNSYNVFDKVKNAVKSLIGEWSAGCVVCNDETKYEEIINKTKAQAGVSFCLLKEF